MLIPKQIVAMAKIVAKAAGRFAGPVVRIERSEHGPHAMATDGHRAVVFSWDEPEPGQFPAVEGLSPTPARQFAANLPAKTLRDAGRGVAKRPVNPALGHVLLDECDPTVVRLAATARGNITRAEAGRQDEGFPDCQGVIPTPGQEGNVYDPHRHGAAAFTHTRIGVNAKQLAQTLQVVSELASDDASNTVVMTVPIDPHRPLRLDARCASRRASAAVMPVPAEFKDYDQPPPPPKAISSSSPKRRRKRLAAPAVSVTDPIATTAPIPSPAPTGLRATRRR
ncbi:MAG TPA: hypothetical protein VFE47_18790 [Tepidisphaeraceae bacterium]|jgi:hypothetical protein|nr:hypothetical protein [Tepidisphaeraceae bacterium]